MKTRSCLPLILFSLALPSASFASTYSILLRGGTSCQILTDETSSVFVSDFQQFLNPVNGVGQGNARAGAGGGSLGVETNVSSFGDAFGSDNIIVSCARAEAVILDFVATANVPAGTQASTWFELEWTGRALGGAVGLGDYQTIYSVSALGVGTTTSQPVVLDDSIVFGTLQKDINERITSGEFTITAGVPFRVQMSLNSTSSARARLDLDGLPSEYETSGIFTNTLKFVTDGPVFNLPDGWTVNSVDANIIDNMYIEDADGDGVADNADNCTGLTNPDQRDTNGDGFGNLCDADLNDDCIVNPLDLGLFRQVFFTADADADFNGDGVVNPLDLGLLKLRFFAPPGPSGTVSTCES